MDGFNKYKTAEGLSFRYVESYDKILQKWVDYQGTIRPSSTSVASAHYQSDDGGSPGHRKRDKAQPMDFDRRVPEGMFQANRAVRLFLPLHHFQLSGISSKKVVACLPSRNSSSLMRLAADIFLVFVQFGT
jgi:hypothetical protein